MSQETEVLDLAGQWTVCLDPEGRGVDAGFFDETFAETIQLPGTTDEARLGKRNTDAPRAHLSREYEYVGPAWYARDVKVPSSWDGSHIELTMERTRETTVWIDGDRVGTNDSLTTAQRYDVTDSIEPGTNRIVVRVDNDAEFMRSTGVQQSHMASEHTQTNWNGILGDITLTARPPVSVNDVQVYPEPRSDSADSWVVRTTASIVNETDEQVRATIQGFVQSDGSTFHEADLVSEEIRLPPETETETELSVTLDEPAVWDEFDPALYTLSLTVTPEGERAGHRCTGTFGLRTFEPDGTQFSVNGKTVFLRGKVDCCVFPETGYAPMDVGAWRDVFRTARRYGINHYRFHSWCPPEAAFTAADELGIYLQPELPLWNPEDSFADDDMYEYYQREQTRILDAYGNHPSFVLFALGNELYGDRDRMAELVAQGQAHDPRQLYAQGSNNFYNDPDLPDGDDFWVSYRTGSADEDDVELRGSHPDHYHGHVNNEYPSTDHDYSETIESYDVPIVSHEIGQYQSYPNFEETEKYTGVLEPRNLETFESHLEAVEMGELAPEFVDASGALQVECYREEIEAALRTEGFGGFQLLDLQDFPGQGTALVGILDAFMDDKGFIAPEDWREFCSPIVPLVRLPSRTFVEDDELVAHVQVAHYGPETLESATVEWRLKSGSTVVSTGSTSGQTLDQGALHDVGTIEVGFEECDAPQALELEVELSGVGATNRYDVWVYPETGIEREQDEIVVAQSLSAARDELESGEDVLFFPDHDSLRMSVGGAFQPDFWNYSHFKDRGNPGTLGLLIDDEHPALSTFPTAIHSDWQWWPIVKNARPMVLDDMPDKYVSLDESSQGYLPIVQAIDNCYENRKLGILFEMEVLDGNLLICTSPLLDLPHPEAHQLYRSLRSYVASDEFRPPQDIPITLLEKLLGQDSS
ncbi:MAG: sugar-binding domain-containing protein [Halorhabdus sp.]